MLRLFCNIRNMYAFTTKLLNNLSFLSNFDENTCIGTAFTNFEREMVAMYSPYMSSYDPNVIVELEQKSSLFKDFLKVKKKKKWNPW